MSVQQVRTSGFEALMTATALLQRARRTEPLAGLWEAADVQWSWRAPLESDEIEHPFWFDDDGPVAGVWLTSAAGAWQCDPLLVPHAPGVDAELLWDRALEHAAAHAPGDFDVPVGDDDAVFAELARRSGLTAGNQDYTAWMDAPDRAEPNGPPDDFVITDRTEREGAPHPLRARNGEHVAERLAQCSLYDPALDLAIETIDGRVAGYSLYWFDTATGVGLVEPVRVHDEFQRRGLAQAMLRAGIDRLAGRGAQRVKVSYETAAAAGLYQGMGFTPSSTTTWYRSSR